MKKLLVLVIVLAFSAAAWSAREDTITVGKCTINVIVAENTNEQATGMLGYTDKTFTYGGMLFEMNSKGRKIFHTQGMQMVIRIMGVAQISDGSYKVSGPMYKAGPGIPRIPIDAPDVLEIPETKYQLQYKRCLMGREGELQ